MKKEHKLRIWLATFLVLFGGCVMTGNCAAAAKQTEEVIMNRLAGKMTSIRGDKLDVKLLLRAMGRQAGVNMVVGEGVEGVISLDLVDVSLHDVFQLVMETKNLHYYVANNALLIDRSEEGQGDLKDVETVRLCSKYGDVKNHMKELGVVKSEDGSMIISNDGNCLIVRDRKDNIIQIRELLAELDVPLPQVHIKAQIVTISKRAAKQLGIKWGYDNLSSRNPLSADVDLSLSNPTTDIMFGFIRDNLMLDVELSALQEKNELFVLSAPRIVVLDGEEAEIKQGQEIPYESGTAENRDTEFREALLSLNVIPKILQNEFIRLNLKVTNDSVDQDTENTDEQPLINRQEIKTNLFLEDGVTVVVGGIILKNSDETNGGVPILSDIPLLGNLFKNSNNADSNSELLVFLTPTILKSQRDFIAPEKVFDKNGRLRETKLKKMSGKRMNTVLDPNIHKKDDTPVQDKGNVYIEPVEVVDRLEGKPENQ